jgi:DNA polymerase
MPVLHRDYETRGVLDLPKVGAARYASHPDSDVRCLAYAIDDGPVQLWTPGDPCPEEWLEAAQDPSFLVAAHNDAFERAIEHHVMGPRYGWPLVPKGRRRPAQHANLFQAPQTGQGRASRPVVA